MGLRLLFPYVPYMPHPKQAVFLSDAVNRIGEVLFGGAASGGKSDALLMAALQYADTPGYSALIIRKTYGELTMDGGILDRAKLWLCTLRYVQDRDGVLRLAPGQLAPDVRGNVSKEAGPEEGQSLEAWGLVTWVAGDWVFRFASGATLRFGHLQTKEARLRYSGSEFQFIAVDELTTLGEKEYTFLLSRLRQPDGPDDDHERAALLEAAHRTGKLHVWMVPLRLRAGTNPGGPGHHWVRNRFIGNVEKGIPRSERSARFVPSRVDDNPSVAKSYRAMLDKLDPVTRRQLRDGSWDDVVAGELFQRGWFDEVEEWEVRGLRWEAGPIRYWDLAATEERKNDAGTALNNPDYAVGAKMAYDGYHWYLLDIVRVRNEPAGVDKAIDRVALLDGVNVQIVIEQEPGASGKMVVNTIARRLGRYQVEGHRPTGSKEVRARVVSSKVSQRLVRVVKASWNHDYYEEAEDFPNGEHDDQVDAVSGAFDRLGITGSAFTTDGAQDEHGTTGDDPFADILDQ